MEADDPKFYITDCLALTSYLELHGLRYVKAERILGARDKIKILFYFLDPLGKGKDLEMEFRFSPEKKYRDGLFFYRKIINDLLGVG